LAFWLNEVTVTGKKP